jgi:hypothetical protein
VSPVFRLAWFFWTKVGPGKVWRGAHLHAFSRDSFEKLLRESGFSIIERKTAFLGMIVFYCLEKNN